MENIACLFYIFSVFYKNGLENYKIQTKSHFKIVLIYIDLMNGMYIFKIVQNNEQIASGKLVIQ
jgi:hypothetical protein